MEVEEVDPWRQGVEAPQVFQVLQAVAEVVEAEVVQRSHHHPFLVVAEAAAAEAVVDR